MRDDAQSVGPVQWKRAHPTCAPQPPDRPSKEIPVPSTEQQAGGTGLPTDAFEAAVVRLSPSVEPESEAGGAAVGPTLALVACMIFHLVGIKKKSRDQSQPAIRQRFVARLLPAARADGGSAARRPDTIMQPPSFAAHRRVPSSNTLGGAEQVRTGCRPACLLREGGSARGHTPRRVAICAAGSPWPWPPSPARSLAGRGRCTRESDLMTPRPSSAVLRWRAVCGRSPAVLPTRPARWRPPRAWLGFVQGATAARPAAPPRQCSRRGAV